MADIDDLLARLEGATEGSRELDAAIGAILHICPNSAPGWLRNWDGPYAPIPDFGRGVGYVACIHDDGRPGANWQSAHYTTSVDAALTLMPDRWRWLLDKRPDADQRHDGYRAEVYRPAHPYKSDRSDVPTHWGPTPALALCVAALRARRVA